MLRKLVVPQSQTNHGLFSSRVLLGMFALLICILSLTHPVSYEPDAVTTVLQVATVVYILAVLVMSFAVAFIKRHLYWFIVSVFYLLAIDFLYQLHLTDFALSYRGSFLIFAVITAWYFRERREVFLYLLSLSLLLVVAYFITPAAAEQTNYLYRFFAIVILAYFFVGSRTRTIQQLIDQDLQYKELIERLNDGIVQVDDEGYVLLFNDKLCELTGYSREELRGKFSMQALLPEDDREVQARRLLVDKDERSRRYEMRLVRKNGEIIWVHVSASPNFDEHGRFLGMTSIITDITDRKVSEEELTQYSFELAQSNRELEQKNQELERFAEIASNDLKAPLQAVLQAVDEIGSYCDQGRYEEAHPFLAKVGQGCQRMNDLIDALLLYSISGSKQMNKQPTDLNEILEEVQQSLDIHIKANNVELVSEPLPTVFADRVQLLRLFRNLIENAIKFRGNKRPRIELSVATNEVKGEYVFSLSDNGLGISEQYYEEIFLIFQKGGNEESTGMGLGLAICRKIIGNHEGRMWLKSTSGQGTTFYFTLPIAIPESPEYTRVLESSPLG